ncbi:ABC transporter substrate-binding protein, partial [Chloroflexota bacterium]
TLTISRTSDPTNWDPFFMIRAEGTLIMETLARRKLEVDPSEFNFTTRFFPFKYREGNLAESWETSSDMTSYTLHIREGIHWQDVPPVNGREFTADDVEYHYHRMLGIGSGFTEGSTYISLRMYAGIESVTATDKYTVVFELKAPELALLEALTADSMYNYMEPREGVEEWGDVNDWKHAIGTGPFMMKDYISGSSITVTRNPNYWRFDPLYPENQLPYVDKVQVLIIPDNSTSIAALRTGKIDLLENLDWEQAGNIQNTNPDMLYATSLRDGYALGFMVDKAPVDDLNVRKAMQMAMDLETLAETYYGGTVDPTPCGLLGTIFEGYYNPYDEWPEDVKEGYTYNPEGAKELLDEAGYPDGFKVTLSAASNSELDLWQIAAAFLSEINIEMELDVIEASSFRTYLRGEKHTMFNTTSAQNIIPPLVNLNRRYSNHPNYSSHHIKDEIFDNLWVEGNACLDEDERMGIIKEADMRAITQHWVVDLLSPKAYHMYNPWLHRYAGQNASELGNMCAWFWIDQDLKDAK